MVATGLLSDHHSDAPTTTDQPFVVVGASLWSSLIYDRALRCQFLQDANSDAPTTTDQLFVVVDASPL